MKNLSVVFTVVFALSGFGEEIDGQKNSTDPSRKIKGQYYVTRTTVTKIVGAEGLSMEFLEFLKNHVNNTVIPQNMTIVFGARGSDIPYLVTENMKTAVTKIFVPLSSNYMENEWYYETLKKLIKKNKILFQDNHGKVQYYNYNNENDISLIILKLFTAATLRENILSIFEDLLYHPQQILEEDMFNSLLAIYNIIKLRRVPLLSVLESLTTMMRQNLHDQFIYLFEQLEYLVPENLRSSVTYWLECLYKKNINLDKILENNKKNINFFGGIHLSKLNTIGLKVSFPESTIIKSSKNNEKILGKFLSYILSEISEKNLGLTPHLLAGILTQLPLKIFSPEVDECQQYIIGVLQKDNRHDFIKAIENLKFNELNTPFALIQEVLKALMTVNFFPHGESVKSILLSLDETTRRSYSNNDYQIMLSLKNSKNVNIRILLDSIVPDEYSPDAIFAKNKLIEYSNTGEINFDILLKDLFKKPYLQPIDIILAVLIRIELSYPVKSEVYESANILKANIAIKKVMRNLRFTLTVQDIISLLSYFENVKMIPNIQFLAGDLKDLFHKEQISLQYALIGYQGKMCISPNNCITNIFNQLISNGIVENEQLKLKMIEMSNILKSNDQV